MINVFEVLWESDSPLGCGPTTRGLRQGLADNFGGVVLPWMANRGLAAY